ncbi:MAG: L,D-transpeptidase [Thermoflexales bacterium]|nr:L,D-transpeptidase [Thermoflexales bacterium]
MHTLSRRDFLKLGSAALLWPALQGVPLASAQEYIGGPPASLGRISTGWRQAVRKEAALKAEVVAWKSYDQVIPLYATVLGEAPWPSNPTWYQTDEGFIHSGYVQPVEDQPQALVVIELAKPGIWVQISIPVAEMRWQPDSPYVGRRLYYGTVYRAVKAVTDKAGNWWYQLQEGVSYSPGPHIPAASARYLSPEALAPISPGLPDKRVQIDVKAQTLVCFEGETAVFGCPIASGLPGMITPRGEYRVLVKRHTDYMIGGSGNDYYNLPGVAFPTYFTWSGIAIHGTYWHNDYGRPKSHGCVNVPNDAAQWVFRWTEPAVPYTDYALRAPKDAGTRVVVV